MQMFKFTFNGKTYSIEIDPIIDDWILTTERQGMFRPVAFGSTDGTTFMERNWNPSAEERRWSREKQEALINAAERAFKGIWN